jgi:Domain of unknown function (DUF4041)/T5orf172 domain
VQLCFIPGIAFAALCLAVAVIALRRERNVKRRYAVIKDVEAHSAAATESLNAYLTESDLRRTQLSEDYKKALDRYERLKSEVSLLETAAEDISFGLYEPHFQFDTPNGYKLKLEQIREQQKYMVHAGEAVTCPVQWHVGHSRREGERMVKLHMKLALRAFNGECDAAVADVGWSNITRMEERITKAYDSINKLGNILQIHIASTYLALKWDELRLKYELEEKKYKDREEQRRVREEMREEDRANREIESALAEAETDEQRFQNALLGAREEIAAAAGAKLDRLTEQIAKFEAKLDEARAKKERAIARAQLTKSGFVYVISNIGSFGQNVFKIGMTRRLEPIERIYELSGASVPFPFDLHAMMYSDNAPELENALHWHFDNRKLNLVNARREFYKDLRLEDIEQFVRSRGLSAQFISTAEAREYRQTEARRKALEQQQNEAKTPIQPTFPADLFQQDRA